MRKIHTFDKEESVVFRGDGEPRTMRNFLNHLNDFAASNDLDDDDFSVGGLVGKLEQTIATKLKKPAAIFMPTGTLANHLAIRRHAKTAGRAAVQEQSHIFNDTGDSIPRLSGIQLLPLGKDNPSFSLDELQKAYQTSNTGRVLNPISVVSIETPVRRQHGQTVPWSELNQLARFCQETSIPIHLDGARIFMQAMTEGKAVHEYTALFDSVYISLYKYFGAPFGGILAGEEAFIEGLYHERRMFGSGLAHSSVVAALALHGIDGFEIKFDQAMQKATELFRDLNALKHLSIDAFEHGSNIFKLKVSDNLSIEILTEYLESVGIFIYPEGNLQIAYLHVNSTLLRRTNQEILTEFSNATQFAAVR